MTSRDAIARGNDLLSPTRSDLEIHEFRPGQNSSGSVKGRISIVEKDGRIVHGFKLMRGPSGRLWISMPAEQMRDRDGRPVLDANGRARWFRFIEFTSKGASDQFGEKILDALRRRHPEAFDDEAAS